ELGRDRLPQHDRARGLGRADRGARDVRHATREQRAAVLGRDPGRVEDVLDADRDTLERTHCAARTPALIGCRGEPLRARGVEPDEGVDLRLGLGVAAHRALDERDAGQRAGFERPGEADEVVGDDPHDARIVTRGVQPLGRPGRMPRTVRKPALRNIACVPKNAKSSCTRLPSDRGWASTAGAPRFPAYSTAARIIATATPLPRYPRRTVMHGTTQAATSSTGGVAFDFATREKS